MSEQIELPPGTVGLVAKAICEATTSAGYTFCMSSVASAEDLARAVDQQATAEAMQSVARAAIVETLRGLAASGWCCRRPEGA